MERKHQITEKKENNTFELLFASTEAGGIGRVGTMRILRGRFSKLLSAVGRALSYSSTRAYGCFFLAFGILTLLLHFGKYYFLDNPEVGITTIVTGILLSLISIPLLIVDKPMCIALQDFVITDYLFYEFFSIKRMHRVAVKERVHPLVMLFLGFIPAIVGFFLPVQYVVIAIAVIAFVAIAFTTPEFPMIFTLLILPYAEGHVYILLSLTALTFLSYAFKVIVGKRVYSFDIYSILLVVFVIVTLISGFLSDAADSLSKSLSLVALAFGYLPISNLISNRRLAECATNAVVVSSTPIAILAVIEAIVELPTTPFTPPAHSGEGTSVFFDSSISLAAFMLVSIVLTLSLIAEEKNRLRGLLYTLAFILQNVAFVLTMQPIAWLSAVLTAIAYLIIISKRIPVIFVAGLFVLVQLVFLLPVEFLSRISDSLGMSPTFAECILNYSAALRAIPDSLVFGIGMGASLGGEEGRILNTPLGIALEIGIIALAVLAIMILLRLGHVSYYRRYTRSSPLRGVVNTSTLAVVALLLVGANTYIFDSSTATCLLWSLLGICSAGLNVAKKEYDDRLGYYGDFQSHDAAVLDINLR